ncbi:hypothetical protein KKC13_08320 [bacterium]|nr:hypothetical protein [bacterium]MBU1959467.1 hypothetical protein [bacterium]
MKKSLWILITLLFINGCTQVITAPISVAGAVTGAAIDVTAATARAVTGSNDDEKDD